MPFPYSTALRGSRILVAEDSYLIAQELSEVLEREGAVVIGPVSSVSDAQRLARELSHLDAAILEVNLRGQMIWPVADTLFRRQVLLVFATGYSAVSIKARYRGVQVVEKPTPARMVTGLLSDALLYASNP